MKKRYLIDGNNLLHKIPKLSRNNNTDSRLTLALKVDRYFTGKNIICTIVFDGHRKDIIRTNKIRIEYSGNLTADDVIRNEIERAKNTKLLTVISSDNGITDLAKVCSCEIIKSEEFSKMLDNNNFNSEIIESKIIDKLKNNNWVQLFEKGKK
ncbi:MAG TPA: NYN domain-containing protein [Melioribacteraceae bacterium]|nr:NYN domain-containing protein [Melioribacteraceae bacterium]